MAGRADMDRPDDSAPGPGGKVVRILFVCLGNICRSPTADGVFRKLVAEAGLSHRFESDSAGISDYHKGEPPDERAAAAARRRGIDLSAMRARGVVPADLRAFDFLLAMDEPVRRRLGGMHRLSGAGESAKIGLFLDHAPHLPVREVPDPYLGGEEHFEAVLDLIEEGAKGLLAHLQREP